MVRYCNVAHLWLSILYCTYIGRCATHFYEYAINCSQMKESPSYTCCWAGQDGNDRLAPKSVHVCDPTITFHYENRSNNFLISHSRFDKVSRCCCLRQYASVYCRCEGPYFKPI